MKKLSAPQLKELIISTLSEHPEFSCDENTMPFLCSIDNERFYIYVKNVSSAYFPNSPDITRVQLPNHSDFDLILKSDSPFVMLGYDIKNEVIICWNPRNLKKRLNGSKNISLYSRQSYQDEVMSDEFKFVYLSNGDKIIMFKRNNLTKFLLNIDFLFDSETDSISIDLRNNYTDNVDSEFIVNGKLTKITDTELIQRITPYIQGYHLFQAVAIVMEYYTEQFPGMSFKDWSPIVRKLKDELFDCF